MKKILGILGGMGPMASAEFLKTIYEFALTLAQLEQELPICILYSDPTIYDRTYVITNNLSRLLVKSLINKFEALEQIGVTKVVIPCITAHHFLPKLPLQMQKKVISLIDIIINEVLNTQKKYLLLCTKGTRYAEIFQNHNDWHLIKNFILFPDAHDQNSIHDKIYKIKAESHHDLEYYKYYLDYLADQYQVEAFIAGCTEIHLLSKHLVKSKKVDNVNYSIVDPLLIFATNLRRFVNAP